ncbi:MAG: hypothetical protein CVT65_03615 [Actinobacteria bacterium HGW-Actinobacteria-5]|nr:MAG: hypothetical protein CVT65_03615 [Actinobacteria bacterium HGW-Actinobacteria-5]
MLSQTVAREVRAELGRQSISRKTFAEKACLPYKRALEMLDGQRPWGLEDVDTAASVLGVDALNLIFPDRVEASAA